MVETNDSAKAGPCNEACGQPTAKCPESSGFKKAKTSNKKLLVTRASLLATRTLLLVTSNTLCETLRPSLTEQKPRLGSVDGRQSPPPGLRPHERHQEFQPDAKTNKQINTSNDTFHMCSASKFHTYANNKRLHDL